MSTLQYGSTGLDQGSFGTHVVWKAKFLYHIPAGVPLDDAAVMMCGGMTVFTPFVRYNITATDCVGVIGVGGLGHLAIQFAAKMGCTVVVFSRTAEKEREAMALGATAFIATKGKINLDLAGRRINHLFVTSNVLPDWTP